MRAALVRQAVRYPLSIPLDPPQNNTEISSPPVQPRKSTVTDECGASPYWAQVSQACPSFFVISKRTGYCLFTFRITRLSQGYKQLYMICVCSLVSGSVYSVLRLYLGNIVSWELTYQSFGVSWTMKGYVSCTNINLDHCGGVVAEATIHDGMSGS